VYRPSCGPSWSSIAALRCFAAQMSQLPIAMATASSVNAA
jgi:hypothetical protein